MNQFILLMTLSLLVPAAYAQQTEKLAEPVLILNLGNDILGVQQTDRHLTNSFTLGVVTGELPAWLTKYLKEDPNTEYTMSLSQQMYTPEDLDDPNLIEDDRPYAGWLFMRFQASKRDKNRLSINAVEIGVIGPASLAEDLQVAVHKLTDSEEAKGWDNQLNNELGINLIHVEAIGKRWNGRRIDHDVVAYIDGSLGNVQTFAEAGAIYRVGYNVPDDMAAGYLGGNSIGTRESPQNFSAYLMMGAAGQYVIQDIFLDGNTFTDSHSVEKNSLVGALQAGMIVAYRFVEVGYVNAVITEQFKDQKGSDHNGLIFFRFKKKF